MDFNIESNKVSFFFCVPHYFWRHILVNKKSKIEKVLKYFLNEDEYSFIYNGNIIDASLTFDDIGVAEGTTLIACKKTEKSLNNEALEMMRLSNDSYFDNRLKILSDKKMKEEQNRISDVRYMKIEGSLKMYRKQLHKQYLKEINESTCHINNASNIDYQPLSMPCTDAMPVLW